MAWRRIRIWLAGLLAVAGMAVGPVAAAAATPFALRADDLVPLFNGEAAPEDLFTEEFLKAVPAAQVKALAAQMVAQGGRALKVARVEQSSPHGGTILLDLERSTLSLRMAIEGDPPHRIAGLLIEANTPRADSMAAILAALKSLPGRVSFATARLGESGPELLHGDAPDQALAIGSAFKLFILAELSRQVRDGERAWSDTIRLDRRSLPSGMLQDWPLGSPVTLHSLAALMTSISDNSATDVLLHALGRERVEALLPRLGLADPARNRPFLSTYEAFALKYGADRTLLDAFARADPAAKRAMLARLAALPAATIDPARAGGRPAGIATAEWFASASDLVRTMDWLRRNGGEETLRILSIAPGVAPAIAGRFTYIGYKGGSEPGVLNMTFLVRTRGGSWLVVTGSWNDEARPLQPEAFAPLMQRALILLADGG